MPSRVIGQKIERFNIVAGRTVAEIRIALATLPDTAVVTSIEEGDAMYYGGLPDFTIIAEDRL